MNEHADTPAHALRPARHVDASDLRALAEHWCLEGWQPDAERLIGWRLMSSPSPGALPAPLRIPGLRHVFWDSGGSATPASDPTGMLQAGGWPLALVSGPDAAAIALAEPQLALLDHLATDDPIAAAIADELGIPLWWLSAEQPPAHLHVERHLAPGPGSTCAPDARLAAWAELVGPVAAMQVAARPIGLGLAFLGDEQAAVERCFAAFQAGDHPAAEAAAKRTLLLHPHRSDLWHLLGVLAQLAGRPERAAVHFRHVTRSTPGFAQGWHSLALAELACARHPEALDAVQHAVAASPGHAGIRALHARLLQQTGHIELAATEAANARRLSPGDPIALREEADALAQLGRSDEAIPLYRQALQLQPGAVDVHFNLAVVLHRSGHADQALPHLDQVLASTGSEDPLHLRSLAERAQAHSACGAWAPAVSDARRACELAPGDWTHLRRLVRLERQVRHPERALALLDAWAGHPAGTSDQVRAAGATSVAVATLPADLRIDRHLLQQELADWSRQVPEAELADTLGELLQSPTRDLPTPADLQWLGQRPQSLNGEAASRLLERRHGHLAQLHQAQRLEAPLHREQPLRPPHRPRVAPRPLRIAYAYAEHPDGRDAQRVQALLAEHDPARFDAWACSWGRADGRLVSAHEQADEADLRLIDLTGHTDRAARQHLGDLGIDVLLDLEGDGLLHRAGLLASRPAPLQLTWLDRHGAPLPPWVDAALAQRGSFDPGRPDAQRIIEMPHAHFALDRRARARLQPFSSTVPLAPHRAVAGLPERAPVLACWAPCRQIQPEVFQLWMRLLRACPPAVLWLREQNALTSQHLCSAAAASGVDPGRLRFARGGFSEAGSPWLGLADLHLAPGATTDPDSIGEALAAGVPAIEFSAGTPAGAGAFWLAEAGLSGHDLVCHDLTGYEGLAMRCLRQPRELMALRRKLQQNAQQAALFDTRRHVRQLEAVLEELHAGWHERRPAAKLRQDARRSQ